MKIYGNKKPEELTLEDGSRLALEDATDIEEHERFVTERSYNLGSYFIKSEVQYTLVYEDGSRIIEEYALSFGEDGARLPPLGLTSVSVYVNFE